MATTRWTDKENKNIEDVIKLILEHKTADSNDAGNLTYKNWATVKEFTENQTIILNDRKIIFNYISFSYDTIQSGAQPIEDRTRPHKGFIIVYDNGVNVNYIINQNSYALLILRKLMGYTGKNEVCSNSFNLTSDLFVWLISKVYNLDNILGENDDDLSTSITLESIKGFKGNTNDLLTRVSAYGESVINIISTLSFLLESNILNQIKLDLSYKQHSNIELQIDKSTITIVPESYEGDFNDNNAKVLMISKLYLLTYLEILPTILQTYSVEVDEGTWSKQKYIDFLNNVANDLRERVDEKILLLNK
jgi:hypothetical protein